MQKIDTGIIGITMGDPAGVGPEVSFKAYSHFQNTNCTPLFIGRFDVYESYSFLLPAGFELVHISSPWELKKNLPLSEPKKIYICDVNEGEEFPLPGLGTPLTGAQSLNYIDTAIDLWKDELIDALVTAPVSKSLIEKSGVLFTGHTEYIAEKTGGEPFMMMYSPEYTVVLVTTHIPIQHVYDSIGRVDIEKTISAAHKAIRKTGVEKPRLAVAGLDPHCGDDGAISTFDRDITRRAVENMRESGIDVEGPFAADTLFIPERWRKYDAAIAMYHDQGLIPFKMCAFDTGVNVTLGLPIIRTSVDHGTAFDIAGKNQANCTSMIHAYQFACSLVGI